MGMTPRDRFLTAIHGGTPDGLALTIWNNKFPGGEPDAQLLDLGVCVIVKSSVWNIEYDGMQVEYQDEELSEAMTQRTFTYHTRFGKVREVRIMEPGTTWIKEFMFKSPADYKAVEEIIASRLYTADYGRFLKDDARYGDQSVARPATIHSPFHELIYEFMGMEAFSLEYAMNPDRLHGLEEVLTMNWKKRISQVESSPAQYCIVEGNTDVRVVSPQMFTEHYHPFIQEACGQLHDRNILAGAHLDSNNSKLAELFEETDIDLVESFTPPPDCDMSIAEARRAWPGKAIQIHFPSSVHLYDGERMKSYCKNLMEQLEGMKAVAIGVSEDVPGRGINTLVPMYSYLREFSKQTV